MRSGLSLAVVVLCLGVVVGATPLAGAAVPATDLHVVPAGKVGGLPAPEKADVASVIETYPGVVLARLSDGRVATVRSDGIVVKTYEEYGIISLNGVKVDAAATPATWAGPGGYIVQTTGPVKPEWRAQIEVHGTILDYVPHFGFLVWLDSDQLPALRSLPHVRAITTYFDAFKTARILQPLFGAEAPPQSILVQLYDPSFRVDPHALASQIGARYDVQAGIETPMLPPYRLLKFDGVDVNALAPLVTRKDVFYVDQWLPPRLEDEVSVQIIAGNLQGNTPVRGYAAWLNYIGIDGTGFVMGHSDSGVDTDHVDFESRVSGPSASGSGADHGTHTMSTILGKPIAGGADANGFLYGQGVAPGGRGYAVSLGASQARTTEMLNNNAIGSSNSWGSGTASDYGSQERQQDLWVIDGDPNVAGNQPFAQVFSAGNEGTGGLTRPKAAKNVLTTCASNNGRGADINSKASFSSVGPAADGRIKPEFCAPGASIYSAQSGTTTGYVSMSGTSMACPHAAGSTLLVYQWYTKEYGTAPSPAMNKMMLINGATDMVGGNTGAIPNNLEGWGRLHLNATFGKASGIAMTHVDGQQLGTGQEYKLTASPADTSRPLKITVGWSDVAGAAGANPALVNDLDLLVVGTAGTYNGNNFQNSWSQTGGTADKLNNHENVYIQNPSGSYDITIRGANVPSGPQPFALVISNFGSGGGGIARIDVTPPTAAISADATQQFSAQAFDASGNTTPATFTWQATAGSVSSSGLFTPSTVGTITVYANASGKSGNAQVTVRAGALASILVTPPTATVTVGGTQQFGADGRDSKGNAVAVNVNWSAAPGSVSASGLFTAETTTGSATVTATETGGSGISGSSAVTVVAGAATRMEVSPAGTTITADQTQQYSAAGFDQHGNPATVTPSWAASTGSISSSGLYSPTLVGTHTVTATDGSLTASTPITVTAGALAEIEVQPAIVTISTDDTQRFAAAGSDANGNPVPVVPTWAASAGTISTDGLFTPLDPGTVVITASSSGMSGTATANVVPGKLAKITVSPPQSTIAADQTLRLSLKGEDAKGNTVPLGVVQWTTTGGAVAGDASGATYTPAKAGSWQVIAAEAGVSGEAGVVVIPGKPAKVEVRPSEAVVREGDSHQFEAVVTDSKENVIEGATIEWSVTASLGAISGEGVFSARKPGAGEVTAKATKDGGSATGSASIQVTALTLDQRFYKTAGGQLNAMLLLLLIAAVIAGIVGALLVRRRKRRQKSAQAAATASHGGYFGGPGPDGPFPDPYGGSSEFPAGPPTRPGEWSSPPDPVQPPAAPAEPMTPPPTAQPSAEPVEPTTPPPGQ